MYQQYKSVVTDADKQCAAHTGTREVWTEKAAFDRIKYIAYCLDGVTITRSVQQERY